MFQNQFRNKKSQKSNILHLKSEVHTVHTGRFPLQNLRKGQIIIHNSSNLQSIRKRKLPHHPSPPCRLDPWQLAGISNHPAHEQVSTENWFHYNISRAPITGTIPWTLVWATCKHPPRPRSPFSLYWTAPLPCWSPHPWCTLSQYHLCPILAKFSLLVSGTHDLLLYALKATSEVALAHLIIWIKG